MVPVKQMSHLIQGIFFDASTLVKGSVIPHSTHVSPSPSPALSVGLHAFFLHCLCFTALATDPLCLGLCSRNGPRSNSGSSGSTSLSS